MCLPPNIPCDYFKILLNSPIDILKRKDCEFCQFLANALRPLLPKPGQTADLSSAQLKLNFRMTNDARQTGYAHWSLLMVLYENSSVAINVTEIHQKFLRDVCAKCIAGTYLRCLIGGKSTLKSSRRGRAPG